MRRPPSRFGNAQMAHSVSWTLLKKAYEMAQGLTLEALIDDYLVHDWASLNEQFSPLLEAEIQTKFD